MKEELVIPIKRYYMLIAVFDAAFVSYGLSVFVDLSSKNISEILFEFSFLLILFFYGSWFTFGKEEINFHDELLVYKKILGPFVLKRRYRYENIVDLRIMDTPSSSIEKNTNYIKEIRRAFPFWYNMGRIRFRYKNRSITILNGIDNVNQDSVLNLLKLKIGEKQGEL